MNQEKQQNSLGGYKNYKPLKCWQKLLKRTHHYSQLPDRKIITNIPDHQLGFNQIQTSKYNVISFFPVNLLQQFTKPSNIYFLLIGILQIIPQITISQGKPTMFLPLTIVVAVSMIKDFLEDWKRHKSDKKENNSQVQVVTEIGLLKRKWETIQVGQIIKVNKEEYFPCDVLLLQHSSESKVAYVQTKNLDGENNLKLKKVPDCLSKQFTQDWLQISNLRYEVMYEKPNPFLGVFNGNIKFSNKKYMLDNNNVILRGCSLKINEYVIGMCLYNGHQSKILLNSANSKPKRSYIETYLNSYFKYIFLFQLTVTLISAVVYGVMLGLNYQVYTYFGEGKQFFIDAVFAWGSWFISFANFIPISLLVTVEFVRFGQGKILEGDPKMKSNDFNAQVQTSSVNDDLGQIQYVLSDKTGTLTKNQMDFKFLYVNGVSYGQNQLLRFDVLGDHTKTLKQNYQQQQYQRSVEPSINLEEEQEQDEPRIKSKLIEQLDSAKSMNRTDLLQKSKNDKKKYKKQKSQLIDKTIAMKKILKLKSSNVDFPQSQKRKLLQDFKRSDQHKQALRLSLVHLALCHNVICEGDDYTSSSPDQVALVSFARYIGYKFLRKNDKNELQIQQKLPGQKTRVIKYQLLHTLQFSSQRKRMSVIVKEITLFNELLSEKKQRILLLCKGADDVILKNLSKDSKQNSESKLKQVHNELFNYACKGLRTLVLVYKQLSIDNYNQWDTRYNQAWTLISSTRYQKVCQLQAEIQTLMHFVAITAIEDKLQDQVKETISQLKKSSIKVWMLTGDKKQTAVSIGYSCGLVDPSNQIITLDCQPEHAKQLIKNVESMLPMIPQDKVTVLSGQFITKLDDQARESLASILKQSVSVICCRVSPKGKQEITSIVKKWGRTLAIGDGANDVNMINSAHIGVGVKGIEGSQATRAADYVISEFKMLRRLVLFYGLNFYHRNCGVMLFTLYKNIFVTFPILFYGPLSIESAVFIYEMWIFQLFNLFFAALPIVYFGLFDTIYSQKQILNNPYLYTEGQGHQYFNRYILVRQILTTVISSIFIVFTAFYITNLTFGSNSLLIYESWTGMLIFNVVIVGVNVRIFNMSSQLSFVQIMLCFFGIGMYYLSFFLVEILFWTQVKNTLQHQVSYWLYWWLLFFYVFTVEGCYHIVDRLGYVNLKLIHIKQKGSYEKDQELKEFRSSTKNLQDITIQKRMSIGGYAFAEDQQRSLHFI